MLRQMASSYSLLDANETTNWVASSGAEQFIADLSDTKAKAWAVTGSFAASRLVSVTAPEIAVVYADDPERIATLPGSVKSEMAGTSSSPARTIRSCSNAPGPETTSSTPRWRRSPSTASPVPVGCPPKAKHCSNGCNTKHHDGKPRPSRPLPTSHDSELRIEYVEARSVLLDALTALQPHLGAVVLIGAKPCTSEPPADCPPISRSRPMPISSSTPASSLTFRSSAMPWQPQSSSFPASPESGNDEWTALASTGR